MTRYFHCKGLAARVVEYYSTVGNDYLLTEKLRKDFHHVGKNRIERLITIYTPTK